MAKKKKNPAKTVRIAAAVLFMLFTGFAFSGFGGAAACFLHVQFGPAVMSCIAAFSAGALSVVLGIAVLTFLFGRFYCSVLCPFGILQDVFLFLSRRKNLNVPDFPAMRYGIAGAVYGLLPAGWTVGFLLLDPYSNFGRISGSFTAGGAVVLILIAALSIWKGRLYCTAVCPVGTVLGLLAKKGVFRISLTEKCVKCGKCVKNCPAGCIDPAAGHVDNERCIRCMNCLSACALGGIRFGLEERKEIPFSGSRRAFLINSCFLIGGAAAGTALAKAGLGKLADFARRFRILPPGAGDSVRFASKCTSCQLCTANCPAKIIVPAAGGVGPVSLDLGRGSCKFDCNRCSEVCPTGAIRPLSLAMKRRTKIAEAKFDPRSCIVFQDGTECGRCAAACPAKAIVLRKNGTPRPVKANLCIGCGACQEVCPAEPKAMVVSGIEKQSVVGA